ncbi:hypothetical protein [Streptosporangium pseudovulgare]|uniref:Uncharacterized protein n=1 Tax=Streptosporangium pseudovulgare TaxID=35765 RepID=A0ABQ2RCN7_9ACTN|nr:hypothetical protein [Streptosporangium pseudovulgare]GGQ25202.1 hypothetical protein GCM10010140_64390 [Streptosporangium pseudovulgare]
MRVRHWWSAAALLALFPSVTAWAGSRLIASTGLFYYDFHVIDGIGIYPLAQGLGIGYLGSVGMDIMHALGNVEVVMLAFALPVPMVAVAALLRRRWQDRTTVVVAVILGVLAAVNFAANVVGPWSDLTQCPPADPMSLPDEYTCYRDGTGIGIPPFLYGPAYALAAYILIKLHRRNLADASRRSEARDSADVIT